MWYPRGKLQLKPVAIMPLAQQAFMAYVTNMWLVRWLRGYECLLTASRHPADAAKAFEFIKHLSPPNYNLIGLN